MFRQVNTYKVIYCEFLFHIKRSTHFKIVNFMFIFIIKLSLKFIVDLFQNMQKVIKFNALKEQIIFRS